jgi:D-glycero-alpha-D-manno-heptose-7-phosphate kinase
MLEAVLRRWAPPGCSLEVVVSSAVPPGSSLGTSAAVVVALIAALQWLSGEKPVPADLARAAHEIETVDLGRQSGVQDQAAAAFGGANLVTIQPYPHFEVERLELPPATLEALSQRVFTVYLGGSHDSSALHNAVISRLAPGTGTAERLLAPLRAAAAGAAQALLDGDLDAYGGAMVACTEAQAALHPDLVSPTASRVIQAAADAKAVGWKVNGAGGPGGTVSIIAPEGPAKPFVEALQQTGPVSVLALQPAPEGAHVEDDG